MSLTRKKVFKMTFLILTVLVSAVLLFAACAPQLGAVGKHGRIEASSNYRDGRFHNLVATRVGGFDGEMLKATLEYFRGGQQREPLETIPTARLDPETLGESDALRVTWLGHSTALIEIDGKTILTDPVFDGRASPFSFMGPKRFDSMLPITPDQLPALDLVLISHDHYDHLDHSSIVALKEKVARFYVPLGVGGHLQRWGVEKEKVVELDWWEEAHYAGLTLVATPTRHFSGRGLRRDRTLWGSWVMLGEQERVFFGGDSGYFDGFKRIGEKYGPFNLTLLESGAYNEAWPEIHMLPEETVQAHIDLRGELLLPIHWGKFNLSLHAWTEPIERLLAEAENQGVATVTPLQGQPVLAKGPSHSVRWWERSVPVKYAAAKVVESTE